MFPPITPFVPARGAAHPHAQTILAHLLRRDGGVDFRRERIPTPDGDFVDIDFAYVKRYRWLWTAAAAGRPIVLALHGLEGDARRGYMAETYRQLARLGVRGVGLNFRSCSGEMNRTTRLYNAGATSDPALVLAQLARRFPDAPLGLVGFSLGANVVLKYMGESGAHVQAAAAVSPPFDLDRGADKLNQGVGQFYLERIMRSLRQKAELKAAQLDRLVDLNAVRAARTFREFDEAWAPIHGYASAKDYYTQCSSRNFLAAIRRPTLILRALDDPFFEAAAVPHQLLADNDCLHVSLPAHGGHVAFLARGRQFWGERQAARFLAAQLSATE